MKRSIHGNHRLSSQSASSNKIIKWSLSVRVCVCIAIVSTVGGCRAAATNWELKKKWNYVTLGLLYFFRFFPLFFLNWTKRNLMIAVFFHRLYKSNIYTKKFNSIGILWRLIYFLGIALDDPISIAKIGHSIKSFNQIESADDMAGVQFIVWTAPRIQIKPFSLASDVCSHCEHAHCLRSTVLRLSTNTPGKNRHTHRTAAYWHRRGRRCRHLLLANTQLTSLTVNQKLERINQ